MFTDFSCDLVSPRGQLPTTGRKYLQRMGTGERAIDWSHVVAGIFRLWELYRTRIFSRYECGASKYRELFRNSYIGGLAETLGKWTTESFFGWLRREPQPQTQTVDLSTSYLLHLLSGVYSIFKRGLDISASSHIIRYVNVARRNPIMVLLLFAGSLLTVELVVIFNDHLFMKPYPV
jgi:hypothetical protein